MSEPSSSSPRAFRPSKKATVDELRQGLDELGLDSTGKKETLFRRLVGYFKRSSPSPAASGIGGEPNTSASGDNGHAGPSKKKLGKQPYRSYLAFDVEATCRGGKEFDWPNEIIEFPVVLLQWVEDSAQTTSSEDQANGEDDEPERRLKVMDTFRTYVRPTWNPKLSEFCTNLTGITQETVDASPTFPEAMKLFEAWLDKHHLKDEEGYLNDAIWVTDGPWDLRDFVPKQLWITPLSPHPHAAYLGGPYLNIKQAFQTVLAEEWRRTEYLKKHPNAPPNARALSRISTGKIVSKKERDNGRVPSFYFTITGMVEKLGLEGGFAGRQHSGLDDATNIARILIALSEKDVIIHPNGQLPHPNSHRKRWPWQGDRPGEVRWDEWMSDSSKLKEWRVENGVDVREVQPPVAPSVPKAEDVQGNCASKEQEAGGKKEEGGVADRQSGETKGEGEGDQPEQISAQAQSVAIATS